VVYIAVYVDDLLIFSSDPEWTKQFKAAFAAAFDIKDLGAPVRVLGMTVVHDRDQQTLLLHQGPYVRDLLSRFHMADAKPASFPSPAAPAPPGPQDTSADDHSQYRSIVGALLFLSVLTRPDIAEVVSRLCRYMHAPTAGHLKDAKYVLRYLKGTSDMGLTFRPVAGTLTLQGFSYSNFTTPDSSGKSVSGYLYNMGSAAISYRSRLQTAVAKSTAEAEYIALGLSSAEAIYLRMLLTELGHPATGPTVIGEDNNACLTIATTTQTSLRTRHIRIEWHFIREAVQNGDIHLEHVPSEDNPADAMTKPLRGPAFFRHRATLLGI
jgi:hypothetical protein